MAPQPEPQVPLSAGERITIGAIGALLPILGNVLVVDLELTFHKLTPATVVGFACRVIVLILFGVVVGYGHKGEQSFWKVLQAGVAAPALFVAMVNGHQFKEAKTQGQEKTSFLVSQAYAQQEPRPKSEPAEDATSVWEEFRRGLFGGSRQSRATVRWFGLTSAASSREVDDPTSPTGKRTVSNNVRLEQVTTRIPGRLGTQFGISYELFEKGPVGADIVHRIVWRFPEPGMQVPTTKKTYLESSKTVSCQIGVSCVQGWKFAEPWEIVPGTWTVEVWIGQDRVLRQPFEVVTPS